METKNAVTGYRIGQAPHRTGDLPDINQGSSSFYVRLTPELYSCWGKTTDTLAVSVCKSFGPELHTSHGFARYLIQ